MHMRPILLLPTSSAEKADVQNLRPWPGVREPAPNAINVKIAVIPNFNEISNMLLI